MKEKVIRYVKKAAKHRVFHSVGFPREVRVWSCAFTFIYNILRLTILFGILGWGFYAGKHLQYEEGQTTITSKVRGVVYTNFSKIPGLSGRVWDAADYVEPPLENGAKFIMTNMVITPRQTQGVCEEDPSVSDAVCNANRPCQPGREVQVGHGLMTGNCVESTRAPGTKVCEVRAWCPVERDDNTTQTATPAFLEAENFTVFIRSTVLFSTYNRIRRNIPSYVDNEQTTCQYDPDHSEYQHCPIFRIGKIVELAGYSFQKVAVMGGIFQVSISWKCDGNDLGNCWPKYSFKRLDRLNIINKWRGFHFRYADHWELPNGTLVRTLYKAIGLRLIFTSEATAFSVDWVKLALSLGSLIGILKIADMIAECFVSGVIDTYDDKKYEYHHHKDSIDEAEGCRDYCSRVFHMYYGCCCKSRGADASSVESLNIV